VGDCEGGGGSRVELASFDLILTVRVETFTRKGNNCWVCNTNWSEMGIGKRNRTKRAQSEAEKREGVHLQQSPREIWKAKTKVARKRVLLLLKKGEKGKL